MTPDVEEASPTTASERADPNEAGLAGRLNRLRAAVLGANDGIVSEAGIVVGVAGATVSRGPVFTAGLAGLVAGAVSMALGEYVSVSSQRDAQREQIAAERRELRGDPVGEERELASMYEAKGLSPQTAQLVARELTEQDALAAHVDVELNLDPGDLVNPWQAAAASAVSFVAGALLPLLAIVLTPSGLRVWVTVAVVLAALVVTGAAAARWGGSSPRRSVVRVLVGGAAGLAVTYLVGRAFGAAVH